MLTYLYIKFNENINFINQTLFSLFFFNLKLFNYIFIFIVRQIQSINLEEKIEIIKYAINYSK